MSEHIPHPLMISTEIKFKRGGPYHDLIIKVICPAVGVVIGILYNDLCFFFGFPLIQTGHIGIDGFRNFHGHIDGPFSSFVKSKDKVFGF